MSEVAEKVKPKSARILNPQRFGLAEQLRQDFVVDAEEGTTVEEVMDPQYWSHIAVQMQPMDTIEVRLDTGDWILKLRVINAGRNWAQMFLEHRYDLMQRAETIPAAQKHKVEYKGKVDKFCVIRRADSEAIQKGFPSEVAAAEWLAGYEKTVSA